MRKKLTFLLFITSHLFISGQTNSLIGSWKLISVKDLKTQHIDSFPRQEKGLYLSFLTETTFKGVLTVNKFESTYSTDKGKIKFELGPTTELCCDRKGSEKFPEYVFQSLSFRIVDNLLILVGRQKVLHLIRIDRKYNWL